MKYFTWNLNSLSHNDSKLIPEHFCFPCTITNFVSRTLLMFNQCVLTSKGMCKFFVLCYLFNFYTKLVTAVKLQYFILFLKNYFIKCLSFKCSFDNSDETHDYKQMEGTVFTGILSVHFLKVGKRKLENHTLARES